MTPELLNAEEGIFDNDLIPAGDTSLGALAEFKDEEFDKVSSASEFLPRLQLYGGNSSAAKEGKIGIGSYGLVRNKDKIEDLGKEVDVIVVGGRPKALRIDGDNIIVKHDTTDPEFLKIKDESDVQDSGCMFGPEFLLYVPSIKQFCTFFMSSKSARMASKDVKARMRKAATLSAEFVKKGKFSWHAPTCQPCSASFELPTMEVLKVAVDKFLGAKDSAVETATTAGDGGRVR